MAQKKNCNKRRQENLPKLPPKNPVSRQPTVEDVMDSNSDEFDDDFIPVDLIVSSDLSNDDSEFDMESNDKDDILKEIQTDSKLFEFASRLQKAQQATKKRKATYLGNSDRSKRRWRAEGKKTEATGFPSVRYLPYF